MLRRLIFLTLAVGTFGAYGQMPRTYFDKDGNPATADDCPYFKEAALQSPVTDTVRTYYCQTHVLRSVEVYNKEHFKQGSSLHYYENAQLAARIPYEKFNILGTEETWHRNGKKRAELVHQDEDGFRVLNYWDSLGNQTVRDGNGYCRGMLGHSSSIIESGKITGGVKDSVWVGYHEDGKKYFEETYEKGKLVTGISFNDAGGHFSYDKSYDNAHPADGLPAFYSNLGKAIRYPKHARRLGVEGRVYIEFMIEKDGSVSQVKCIKGIGAGCDEEAIRVISLSEKWIPGKQRGQNVRQLMVLPLTFKLT